MKTIIEECGGFMWILGVFLFGFVCFYILGATLECNFFLGTSSLEEFFVGCVGVGLFSFGSVFMGCLISFVCKTPK